MGNAPATSVLNRWQQAHDVSNLFVMDGSCYVSSACQNPTFTMMALAARACDYLVQAFRAGHVQGVWVSQDRRCGSASGGAAVVSRRFPCSRDGRAIRRAPD